MQRSLRVFKVGATYHLISRFIAREWYITSDRQRGFYLELLGRALRYSDWTCLAYAVMSSHVHLVMVAGADPLDKWIRRVHSPFADTMNKEHDRIGNMFVRGPKDYLTPPDRVASLIAYVHNNPVRAGLVANASDSDWTSHRAYLGLTTRARWLDVTEGLARAHFTSPHELDAYAKLEPDDPSRKRKRGDDVVDDEDLAPSWTRTVTPKVDPEDVISAAAAAIALPAETLRSRRRGRAQSLARQAVVRCADDLGVSGVAVARAVGISQQRVSAILMQPCESQELSTVIGRVMERLQCREVVK